MVRGGSCSSLGASMYSSEDTVTTFGFLKLHFKNVITALLLQSGLPMHTVTLSLQLSMQENDNFFKVM